MKLGARMIAVILGLLLQLAFVPSGDALTADPSSDISKLQPHALSSLTSSYFTISEGSTPETAKNGGLFRLLLAKLLLLQETEVETNTTFVATDERAIQPVRLWLLHCALLN